MIVHVTKLAQIADAQSGLITAAQARDAGVADGDVAALVEMGLLEWVLPGVLRMRAGGRHPFPRQYARWLLLVPHQSAVERPVPESGVLGGASALRVHKIADVPGPTEIIAADPAALEKVPDTLVTAGTVEARDWFTVSGLPVLVAGRAFTDVVVSGRLDFAELGRVADRLLRSGLADEEDLAERLDSTRSSSPGDGRARLFEMLEAAEASPGTGA